MLQTLKHLHGPPVGPHSSKPMSPLYCWAQNWTQHSRSVPPVLNRGERSSLLTSCNTLSNEVQEAVGLTCHKGTLLAHGQLFVHKGSQFLFCQENKKELSKALISQGNETVILLKGVFFCIFWVVTHHIKHFITFNYIGYTDWLPSLRLFQNSVQTIWKPLFSSRLLGLPFIQGRSLGLQMYLHVHTYHLLPWHNYIKEQQYCFIPSLSASNDPLP